MRREPPELHSTIADDDTLTDEGEIATNAEPHEPLSPATPAEYFFLTSQLGTAGISSIALAATINRGHRKNSSSKSSTSGVSQATEDFQSACDVFSESEYLEDVQIQSQKREISQSPKGGTSGLSLFGKDILIKTEPIHEEEEEAKEPPSNPPATKNPPSADVRDLETTGKGEVLMATRETSIYYSSFSEPIGPKIPSEAMSSPEVVKSESPEDSTMHFGATQQVYEAAKGVWGFARSVPVGGAVLGLWEAAAAKAVDTVVHKDLAGVDADIKPHLSNIDKDVLDPVIDAILKFLAPAIGKSEEMVQPIVKLVLGVFPKQICEGAQNVSVADKEATMPEVSTPAAEGVVGAL